MVSPFFKQFYTISAVWVLLMGHGILLGYTTSLLPALKAPDSPIKADLHTASWLSSSVGVAAVPGFLLSSILMDLYGRRVAYLIITLPGAIGWLMTYFAANITTLVLGRMLAGMSAAGTGSIGAIVIGEYSTPKYRGMFLNLKSASVCIGSMLMHILGHSYHWRTIAIIALVPHIIAAIIIWTWPESPAWLASKKQYEASAKSFNWLRGDSEESQAELEEMIRAQKQSVTLMKNRTCSANIMAFFKKFTRRDFIKPVMVIAVGAVLLEMCGRHFFPSYANQIIVEVTGNKTQLFYHTLVLDIIITVSAVSSSILIKIMRLRTLLFSTGYTACCVLMIVCTYLFLVSKEVLSKDYPWIPIGLFVIYFTLANLGCSSIPLVLLGEVFPLAHRGAGSFVFGFCLSLSVTLILYITPHLFFSINIYGTFTVYGIGVAVCLTILYFIMPETKDRTLQEIENYFNYGKFKNNEVYNDDDSDANIKMIS